MLSQNKAVGLDHRSGPARAFFQPGKNSLSLKHGRAYKNALVRPALDLRVAKR
jgi:hypothetical protein